VIPSASQTLSAIVCNLHTWLESSDRSTERLSKIFALCDRFRYFEIELGLPSFRQLLSSISFLRTAEQADQLRTKFTDCLRLAENIRQRIEPPGIIQDGENKRVDESKPGRVREGENEDDTKAAYMSFVYRVEELVTFLSNVQLWFDSQREANATPPQLQPVRSWLGKRFREQLAASGGGLPMFALSRIIPLQHLSRAGKQAFDDSYRVNLALVPLAEFHSLLSGLNLDPVSTTNKCCVAGWIEKPLYCSVGDSTFDECAARGWENVPFVWANSNPNCLPILSAVVEGADTLENPAPEPPAEEKPAPERLAPKRSDGGPIMSESNAAFPLDHFTPYRILNFVWQICEEWNDGEKRGRKMDSFRTLPPEEFGIAEATIKSLDMYALLWTCEDSLRALRAGFVRSATEAGVSYERAADTYDSAMRQCERWVNPEVLDGPERLKQWQAERRRWDQANEAVRQMAEYIYSISQRERANADARERRKSNDAAPDAQAEPQLRPEADPFQQIGVLLASRLDHLSAAFRQADCTPRQVFRLIDSEGVIWPRFPIYVLADDEKAEAAAQDIQSYFKANPDPTTDEQFQDLLTRARQLTAEAGIPFPESDAVFQKCESKNKRIVGLRLVLGPSAGKEFSYLKRGGPYNLNSILVKESMTLESLTNRLNQFAIQVREARKPALESPAEGSPAPKITWQDVAERLKRLRSQGERWTSGREMAGRFGCSSSTVHRAIQETPEIQSWAKPEGTLKAKSLTPHSKYGEGWAAALTDSTAQTVEPDPGDEAAIREFIEQADTETKAWFLSLSRKDQLEYLNDPDKHQKALGRKP